MAEPAGPGGGGGSCTPLSSVSGAVERTRRVASLHSRSELAEAPPIPSTMGCTSICMFVARACWCFVPLLPNSGGTHARRPTSQHVALAEHEIITDGLMQHYLEQATTKPVLRLRQQAPLTARMFTRFACCCETEKGARHQNLAV